MPLENVPNSSKELPRFPYRPFPNIPVGEQARKYRSEEEQPKHAERGKGRRKERSIREKMDPETDVSGQRKSPPDSRQKQQKYGAGRSIIGFVKRNFEKHGVSPTSLAKDKP